VSEGSTVCSAPGVPAVRAGIRVVLAREKALVALCRVATAALSASGLVLGHGQSDHESDGAAEHASPSPDAEGHEQARDECEAPAANAARRDAERYEP